MEVAIPMSKVDLGNFLYGAHGWLVSGLISKLEVASATAPTKTWTISVDSS